MIEATPIAAQHVQESAPGGGCPDLWEAEERVAYAEAGIGVYCAQFLAAREAERAERQKALDAACKWGRAWRELAEARKALTRERESLALIARVVGRCEAPDYR